MTTASLSPLRILIVDDSKQMCHVLSVLLEAMGITDVLTAYNGDDGHALFLKSAPDIIITDGAMSPTDGYELTARIRADMDSPNPYIPIIMLSGHLDDEDVQRARVSGVSEYLAKPVSSDTLYERLMAIVTNPYYLIRTPTYVGPDRRRATGDIYHGNDRRASVQPSVQDEKIIPLGKVRPLELIKSF